LGVLSSAEPRLPLESVETERVAEALALARRVQI